MRRDAWRARALCRGVDVDVFFPHRHSTAVHDAVRYCEACPVRAECLSASYESGDTYGIWGGLTGAERWARLNGYERDLVATVGRGLAA